MKEALLANTRSLLLTVLILSSSVIPAQAYYHPDEGRWISRDPIQENGGLNLNCFVQNNPVQNMDAFGLLVIYIGGAYELSDHDRIAVFAEDVGATVWAPWDAENSIALGIHERLQDHPCEPTTLIGHSYGGDTALQVAALLQKSDPCYKCLSVVTLDPVSTFHQRLTPSSAMPENVTEWINVAQPATGANYLYSIPGFGTLFGGFFAGIGAFLGNAEWVAAGGGQWNSQPSATYNIPATDANGKVMGHMDITPMMQIEIQELKMSVRQRVQQLQSTPCKCCAGK